MGCNVADVAEIIKIVDLSGPNKLGFDEFEELTGLFFFEGLSEALALSRALR
jgi:hypothetical protein